MNLPRLWATGCVAALVLAVSPASAQSGATTTTHVTTTEQIAAPVAPPAPAAPVDTRRPMWFFGGQYRHFWVPSAIQQVFMDMAPSIKGPSYGLIASRRSVNGFSITFGLAYSDYSFEGFFRQKGDPAQDTEHVLSDMSFWHVTSSFMWSAEFLNVLALEFGFGMDLGLVFGDIRRSEAYRDPTTGGWQRCNGQGDPAYLSASGEPYCEPTAGGGATDPSSQAGAHYDARVGKVSGGGSIPDVFLLPAIPQLAIRIMPIKNVAIRLEAAYNLVQFWVGASLLVGFEVGEIPQAPARPVPAPTTVVARTEVIERTVDAPPPPVAPPPAKGRIRGTVWDEAAQRPVAGATVKLIGRDLSALVSADDGTFVTYDLDPGLITFEITHVDYEPATCAATITAEGGDVPARCTVIAKPRLGNVAGQVVGTRNAPLAGAQVQLTGPTTMAAVTDAAGSFTMERLAPGSYAVRVEAEGYLVKLDQLEVAADATARPQLVLTEKPRRSSVDLRENEIVITRQINFVTNSAKIRPDAEPILVEIADVMLRHPQIRLVEIQGHTDDRGRAERNLELSQQRAESVRQWLLGAGITPDRFEARGYGQTQPIESNRTAAGRTKNRRVQFMIRRQEPVEQ